MHPAFLPCSFGQMVTTAPTGLTIPVRPDQRHRTVPGPSTVTATGESAAGAAITITFVWAVS